MGTTAQEPAEVSTEVAREVRITAGFGPVRGLEAAPHPASAEAAMAISPNKGPTSRRVRDNVRACRELAANEPELTPGIATLTPPSSRRSRSSRPPDEYPPRHKRRYLAP